MRSVEALSSLNARKLVWFDGVYFPLRDADGRVCFLMVLNTDQTALMEERKAVEAAKKEIEAQRETILALESAQREIEAQRETILALSSPIIEVWRGVLALPVIGRLDASRAAEMMSRLLSSIVRTRSRYAILDLTGLMLIDTPTADSLIRIIKSIELLGAQCILVGIQPAISRVLVDLRVDLGGLRSLRTLGDALEECLQALRGPAALPIDG